ncbi:putative F-box protein At5g55150 [Silene latifolia]|uniref:putative F-box protein At5g55150 n=1 Tax=Silene latifolia TaxID=37657 RepID=UPI003D76BF37
MESSSSSSLSSWPWLPDPLLELILSRLNPLSGDYFRFGAVCKDWYKIMKDHRNVIRSKTQIPLLMIPSNKKVKSRRSFFDVTCSRRFDSLHALVPYNIKACGSSHGWLIYLEKTMKIVLYNPFQSHSRKNRENIGVIKLPPVMSIPNAIPYEYSVSKVMLFGNPSITQNYVVLAFYSATNSLALLKGSSSSAPKKWIYLKDIRNDLYKFYTDAIMYKGFIYAVAATRGIISIDPYNDLVVKEIFRWPSMYNIPTYLAESSKGDLFILRRILDEDDNSLFPTTFSFEVFRLKMEENPSMEEVDSLNGDTIFVGDGSSICIAACDFDNCQPNSIYFSDDGFFPIITYPEDYHCGPRDTGIFNLEDRSIKPLYPYDLSHKYLPPAIWVNVEYIAPLLPLLLLLYSPSALSSCQAFVSTLELSRSFCPHQHCLILLE